MTTRKVCYVRFRYSHHSPHSGYSRITEFGEKYLNSQIIPVDKPLSRRIIRDRMLWKIATGTPGYTRAAMAAELKIAWKALTQSSRIYHILYGETNYHYAGYFNGFRDNRVVATFHLPPDRLKKVLQIDWHLKQLAGIVCVGSNQVEYLSQFVAREKLHLIPLGLDVDYYRPPASPDERDPNLCIVIGENYRDFATLRGVVELTAYLRPQTRFVCVMSPKGFAKLGQHPNLELRTGIPEDELLHLYQTAALMVLPFSDATANNAVLESMGCALPAVLSDLGAVRDYVTPESSALVPPFEARAMAEKVIELLENKSLRAEIGARAREQALKFTWQNAIKQHQAVYDSLP
ncbi:MAG TPA: glycosyltransferase family 1 protein [Anaerolineales bacterium]|nr:glycosyltransferase family 1 protein [Anaerolineales bacterium]